MIPKTAFPTCMSDSMMACPTCHDALFGDPMEEVSPSHDHDDDKMASGVVLTDRPLRDRRQSGNGSQCVVAWERGAEGGDAGEYWQSLDLR